jgi:hypothetical protein
MFRRRSGEFLPVDKTSSFATSNDMRVAECGTIPCGLDFGEGRGWLQGLVAGAGCRGWLAWLEQELAGWLEDTRVFCPI